MKASPFPLAKCEQRLLFVSGVSRYDDEINAALNIRQVVCTIKRGYSSARHLALSRNKNKKSCGGGRVRRFKAVNSLQKALIKF